MVIAEQLYRIFQGNDNAHGEYTIKYQKGAKAAGKASTVASPPSAELWQKHLDGELGLGIIPINENSTCTWGAVDVDQYDDLDIEEWSRRIPAPVVVCRSKSGGAHLFLFTQSPVPAALMRKKLTLLARAVGHANAEIFPKQEELNKGDFGNWLNMPYFAAESTTRYALKSGVALTAEEFISVVGDNAINMQQLVSLQFESIFELDNDPEFEDAPPCLQYLVQHGFPPGTRNSALFSMGVFARMKFTTGWEDKVFEYNTRFMGPGTYSEVAGIIRSLNKKSYAYKCKDQPLLAVCDKDACAQCTYGIHLSKDDEKSRRPNILGEVDRPVKCYAPDTNSKDDPYWVFTINGVDIDVTVDMVRSQAIFAREYLRQYHRVILPIKDNKWVSAMNELLSEAEVHQLAPDAGPEGQLWVHIEEFCTSKSQARAREELLLGKPWHEDDRTFFRSSDLMRYLDQQRYRAFKEKDIWSILKRHGAKHHRYNLKGKSVSCWSIFSFQLQTEGFDHVSIPDDREF